MKIMIVGSKAWSNEELIRSVLGRVWEENGCPENVVLVHGNDPSGADMMCDKYAVEHGWSLHIIKPDHDKDGKRAYEVRNRKLLNCGADIALVFSTRRYRPEKMISGLKARGIKHEVFWE